MNSKISRWGLLAIVVGIIGLIGSILWKRSSGVKPSDSIATEPCVNTESLPRLDQGKAQQAKENESDVSVHSIEEIFRSVLSAKGMLVPAVVLGGIGYFLGWRFLFSYYGGFGLDPAFFSFSPTEVVSAGWRMYILITALVILAAFLLAVCQKVMQYLLRKQGLRFIISIFFVFLVAGIALVIYVVYQFFFVWGAHSTNTFYIWAFVSLMCLWIAFIFGQRIHAVFKTKTSQTDLLFAAFRIAFPTPPLWLAIICLGFIITMAFFSGWNGLAYSKRDLGVGSRLQIATLYVSEQLDIPNGQLVRDGVWLYDDLRFIFKTDDIYFLFRLEEVNDDIATLYAIPKKHVLEFRLRSWYDKVVHP